MKKILLSLVLCMCANAHALPGKQEFVMIYPDEELNFINDGDYLIVLSAKKNANDRSRTEPQSCLMAKMEGNQVIVGKNKIVFYDEYAIINDKKRRFYVGKKTDLLFYRHLCKKPD